MENEYPEELSIEEVDNLEDFEYYGLKDLEQALRWSKKLGGMLYTQVDSGMDRVYLKGNHLVNRTGIYLVLIKK